MRVPSHSSNPVRRAPQQDRSTRRVMAFLEAGEALFAEHGFEAATMTAVAERADSSIGSLYSYFPATKALALALLDIYAQKIEEHWRPLFDGIRDLSAKQFADGFIDRYLDVLAEHPAYQQLQAAPVRFRRNKDAKRAFRTTLADALRKRARLLSDEEAMLRANVMLQLVSGMMRVYPEVPAEGRAKVITEFKVALTAYLKTFF
jgi:AcrR family transcriptional regulator